MTVRESIALTTDASGVLLRLTRQHAASSRPSITAINKVQYLPTVSPQGWRRSDALTGEHETFAE